MSFDYTDSSFDSVAFWAGSDSSVLDAAVYSTEADVTVVQYAGGSAGLMVGGTVASRFSIPALMSAANVATMRGKVKTTATLVLPSGSITSVFLQGLTEPRYANAAGKWQCVLSFIKV
jgi:hypothetical protein